MKWFKSLLWTYGMWKSIPARKHKITGNIQFLIGKTRNGKPNWQPLHKDNYLLFKPNP